MVDSIAISVIVRGITTYNSKNGWCNKVTMTTLNTMTFLPMFYKKWRQVPEIPGEEIQKLSFI